MTDIATLGLAIESSSVPRATEHLLRLLPAAKQVENAAEKMSSAASRAYIRMETDIVRSNARIDGSIGKLSSGMGALAKSFGAGLLGGFAAGGLLGIVSQFNQVAESVAKIGDEARRVGLSAKSFQEWRFVAEQARIPVDALSGGFKDLNANASEFIATGKGSAADAFARLGYSASDLKKKLKDPSDLVLEIVDRLGKFDKASQIRLADKVFGGSGGERFVQLIEQGADGIRDTIQQANDLGAVIDDQLIARADEVNKRFGEISNTVGIRLKSAIVSAADSLAEFIDGFRSFENQRNSTLDNELANIGKRRLDIENQILKTRDQQSNAIPGNPFGANYESILHDLEAESQSLSETEQRILKVFANRTEPMKRTASTEWTPPDVPIRNRGAERAAERENAAYVALLKSGQDRIDQLNLEQQMVGKSGAAADTLRFKLDLLQRAADKGRTVDEKKLAAINALTDAYGKAAEKVAFLTANEGLRFEREQMFRSPTEQRVYSDLRNFGLDIDSSQGQAIASQIRLNEQLAIGRDLTYGFASGFVSDLMQGVDAMDALSSAAGRLGDRLIDMALNEAINGLFKNLMGDSSGSGDFFGGLQPINLRSAA